MTTAKRMDWLRRQATRLTPMWVTCGAVLISAGGPALAWLANDRAQRRDEVQDVREMVANCRIRNDAIRNGGIRIDTLVGSLEREFGNTPEARDAGDRLRADQDALPDNEYVDCNSDGSTVDDFTITPED